MQDAPDPGLRMAIDAAKLYYMLVQTSAVLAGQRPQRVGLTLGSAIFIALYEVRV